MSTILPIALSFVISLLLGILISFTYKKINRGFSYDNNLRFSLLFITLIITMIMSIIGSNIALSLGLVGSLSIIRFRTAIKSVVDMIFIFWAVAVGLGVGAGSYGIAIGGAISIALLFFVCDRLSFLFSTNDNYIMIVNYREGKDDKVLASLFNRYVKKMEIKSSNFNHEGDLEIVYTVTFLKNTETEDFLAGLKEFDFVSSVSLVSPDTNLYV